MSRLVASYLAWAGRVASEFWLPGLIVFGFTMSVLYGSLAVPMFLSKQQREQMPRLQYFHQWWLNFAGAAAGWATLIFLVAKLRAAGLTNVAYIDVVIFVVALLGVTGLLPQTLVGLVNATGDLLRRMAQKVVG